jgi:hypothetical protein
MNIELRTLALIGGPALIAAAPAERPLKPAEKSAITHEIEAKLLDPASALFRMGPIRPASEYYCGLVNAKNRMGGYNGFEPFMVRFNADRTIKVVVIPGSTGGGPLSLGDEAYLRDALRQTIREKCAQEGYNPAY